MISAMAISAAVTISAGADLVEMQNGDRYVGKIISLDTNTVVLQNDVLGTVRLPRARATTISIGSAADTNVAGVSSLQNTAATVPTNSVIDLSASLRQLGANTNFIQQIQAQILGAAGPQANNKFNELVGGMLSGKLTVNDIRVEAKTAVSQLKELKRDLGEGAGGELDGYLAILEHFVQETAQPVAGSATNAPAPAPKPKAAPAP